MSERYLIAAFYKFVPLPDYQALQEPLLQLAKQEGLCGSILLAEEGINATIAGAPEKMENFLDSLMDDSRFADLVVKKSYADFKPFKRMKVRLKQEIVRMKVPNIDPNKQVGEYVEPQDWNSLISEPDVLVIDTRNDYEFGLGTFKGASNPETGSFYEFPDYVKQNLEQHKDKKIAMFCTGGIRCEKATAYLMQEGFQKVYHLKGGILRYLEEMPEAESLWQGDCFVFDERITVNHRLEPVVVQLCPQCQNPLSEAGDCQHCP